MDAGDIPTAINLFEQSTKALPHFKTLELLGECLINVGRRQEAVVYLSAASTLGANAFRALFLLATALEQLGEHDEAIQFLDRALAINPDYRAAREARERLASKN